MLEIGIAVESITERRIAYRFEARERDTRRLVCEGAYRVACVNQETFKGTEFPAKLRGLFKRTDELIRAQRQDKGARGAGWA